MNKKLLQKIEELTLYVIEQDKEIKNLEKEVSAYKVLTDKVAELEKFMTKHTTDNQKN